MTLYYQHSFIPKTKIRSHGPSNNRASADAGNIIITKQVIKGAHSIRYRDTISDLNNREQISSKNHHFCPFAVLEPVNDTFGLHVWTFRR